MFGKCCQAVSKTTQGDGAATMASPWASSNRGSCTRDPADTGRSSERCSGQHTGRGRALEGCTYRVQGNWLGWSWLSCCVRSNAPFPGSFVVCRKGLPCHKFLAIEMKMEVFGRDVSSLMKEKKASGEFLFIFSSASYLGVPS